MRLLSLLGLLISFALASGARGQFVITELMARNAQTLQDEDGDTSDWIEVRNTSAAAASLAGWHLTDDATDPAQWTFPAEIVAAGAHLVVFASGKNRAIAGSELHTNFKLDGAGEYCALVTPAGTPATEFAPQFPAQRVDVAYGLEGSTTVLVTSRDPCEALVPSSGSLGTTWQQGTVTGWLTGATGVGYETQVGFEKLIGLDIEQQMLGVNGSAYVRVPFQAPAAPAFGSLTLRMKYDDGFTAHLNGQQIARANAPATVTWNSVATQSHPDNEAIVFENFDVSAALGALQPGANILAIHGLNVTASSTDFLILPELVASTYGTNIGYLPTATPGSTNEAIVSGFVADIVASAGRGLYDNPFAVTLATSTPGATIRYTTDGSQPTETTGAVYQGSVNVPGTTVLRARGFLTGWGPSNTTTHTYIFPRDAFAQPAALPGLPATWGGTGSAGPSIASDYAMDPRITQVPEYASRLRTALESHPVVCLAMDPADWLDPRTGVYISPTNDPRVPRESPTSVEYFEPQGSGAFHIDAGVRVTGNNSTRRWGSKKLSLRLLFKNQYGASRLEYPLFPRPAVAKFETITLDAYFAFTWNYAPYYATQATKIYRWQSSQYTRDHFAPSLIAQMGSLATHGKYVHLFINGLYWGLYNIHERPDEHFMVSYQGGQPEDWDVIRHNQNNVQSGSNAGWLNLMNLVNRSSGSYVRSPAGYAAVQQVLDVQNLADYMIMNLFIGFSQDWPSSNWYSAHDRVAPNARWKMFSWDAEHILKDVNQNSTNYSTSGSPARLYSRLRQNTEFQVLFGDRLHRFFFNGGPLYVNPERPGWDPSNPHNNRPAALYSQIADSIEDAIVLESARWGDAFVTSGPPYTLDGHWKVERDRLLNSYFPRRSAIVLQQFRSGGLYPNLAAPRFAQHGGTVLPGYALAMTGPSGATLWVTTDGTDPRLVGGLVSPNARAYSGPVVLNTTTRVKARARRGTSWSALNEAVFVVEAVMINEVLARNTSGIVDEFGEREDWIELYNKGASPVVVSGMYLTDEPTVPTKWQIPTGYTLNPGDTLLIWADEDESQGPLHANFKLASTGEEVRVYDTDGKTLVSRLTFGPQQADISTGWMRDGGGTLLVTFLDPSPDSPNEIQGCGSRRYSAQDSTSQPVLLRTTGTPGPGQQVRFLMTGGQASTAHTLYLSLSPTELAFPQITSSRLLINDPLLPLATVGSGPSGIAQYTLPLPPIPALTGLHLYFQAWTVSGAATVGSSAVELLLCP